VNQSKKVLPNEPEEPEDLDGPEESGEGEIDDGPEDEIDGVNVPEE